MSFFFLFWPGNKRGSGVKRKGKKRKGKERKGKERTGQDRTGKGGGSLVSYSCVKVISFCLFLENLCFVSLLALSPHSCVPQASSSNGDVYQTNQHRSKQSPGLHVFLNCFFSWFLFVALLSCVGSSCDARWMFCASLLVFVFGGEGDKISGNG